MPVFKTGAFNRSATPPAQRQDDASRAERRPHAYGREALDWRSLTGQVAEWLKALAC